MRGIYDTAQICSNGHVINTMARSNTESNSPFCKHCGANTLTRCSYCEHTIKGHYSIPGRISTGRYSIPSYCENCGRPYPWTERIQQAAFEVIALSDDLTKSDKDDLQTCLPQLLVDTPNTSVAVLKFKKYSLKAGKEIGAALKDVLVDLVSETVKKSIWG